MRLMCLDVGQRRIGVALSDAEERLAYGHGVVHRGNLRTDLDSLAATVETEEVELVVLGLPRSLSGHLGPQAERVQRFGAALAARLAVPIVYWDERLSTVAADRALREAGLSGRARRERVDEQAAILILEGYLAFRRNRASRGAEGREEP
ncbi:MAG: Holliday junction resolvase RuvX [Chloroflexota bacterium]